MSDRMRLSESVSAFALGIGMGAVPGVHFAPRSGSDTRDWFISSAKDKKNRVATAGQALAKRVQDSVEQVKSQVKEATAVGELAYREAKNSSS